jgi:hypothetical protein
VTKRRSIVSCDLDASERQWFNLLIITPNPMRQPPLRLVAFLTLTVASPYGYAQIPRMCAQNGEVNRCNLPHDEIKKPCH